MQTPARFDYERATSLEGAIASLKQHEDARSSPAGTA
jgi:carbon-monoxide dehydrogenase medium subunit